MDKPEFLYHGSSKKKIKVFEPRQESMRDPNEGPVVFATDSPANASKFLVHTNDSWSQLSRFGDLQVAIYSDRAKFMKLDKGGAIYKLPSDNFGIDPLFTKSSREYTSRVPVEPVSKEVFDSGLKAMLKYGIKVYFVAPETLKEIKKAPDHGFSLIKTLTSE